MDPNEIVGSPTERQIWLAPDWSKRGSTAAIAGPGATQVYTRTVTYRDGRVITYVLDENHNPITHQTLSEDTDPEVKKVWDAKQAQTNAQAGVTKPSNVYLGTNPSTGKPTQVSEWPDGHKSYDDTQVPAAIAQAGNTDWHPEGTPDGNGGWDNSRPTMVRTVNGQRQTREPTSAELKDWNEAQQRSRNPGGKTDTELQAQQGGSARVPVPGHPGIYSVTTKTPATASTPERTEAHYENEAGQAVPQPPDAPSVTVQQVLRRGKTYTVHTSTPKDGSQPVVTVLGPDGQVVTGGLPDEPAPRKPETIGGRPYVPSVDDSGAVTGYDAVPVRGRPIPANAPVYTPNVADPNRDAGLSAYAHAVNAAVRDGIIDTAQADALIEQAHQSATTAVAQHAHEQANALTERGQDVTQAGNRLSGANTAFSNAAQAANTTLPYMAVHSQNAPGVMLGNLMLGQMMAGQYGGLQTPPSVTGPAPPTAPLPASLAAAAGPAPEAPPNAIGLGATPETIAPTLPMPTVDPAAAAEAEARRQAAQANPVFRPQPVAAPPGEQAAAPPASVFGALASSTDRLLAELGIDPEARAAGRMRVWGA